MRQFRRMVPRWSQLPQRFREAGRGDLGHRLHRLGDVGLGQPAVQPLQGSGEAAGENGLLGARALGLEVFGWDVGVAERLQHLDRGVLGEVQLVPAGRLGGHVSVGQGPAG